MHLHQLNIVNFKNYPEGAFSFSPKINCLIGNNGVGKTNLLDAIYYLSFCKSYFNPIDSQNILHGEDFFSITGQYFRNDDVPIQLQCIQRRHQRKRFLNNRKEYDRLADHIGKFPLVMISPSDRDLINEGSEVRRRYIDSVISQFNKPYLDHLIRYNKVLAQRNNLLKQFAEQNRYDADGMAVWDDQLVQHGMEIYRERMQFLEEFIPLFQHYFSFLSNAKEPVEIRYVSQLAGHDFSQLLAEVSMADRKAQFTTVGTHKDDLEFLMEGFPVKRFGSQGQQKSFVIAMKLAQFEYTRKTNGFKPILLLDDVFDKLDDLRVQQLIKLVNEHSFGQVFLTNTQEEQIHKVFDPLSIEYKLFTIPHGKKSQ
jgi:DNA replication and repair protein RecF